jgi:very-long-chain enoyl-CoA reductase
MSVVKSFIYFCLYANAKGKLRVERMRLYDGTRSLTDDKLTIPNSTTIKVRDLGPQISWKTVFILEYLGPILIHSWTLIIYQRQVTFTALLSSLSIIFHFLKREYETCFVHRFSNATMPLANIFKNCF